MRALVVSGLVAGSVLSLPPRVHAPDLVGMVRQGRQGTRAPGDPEAECLAVLDSIVALLQAGTPAARALTLATKPVRDAATETAAGWRRLADAAENGADVAAVWDELGAEWDARSCLDVAAAWRMSARHGCPLADAMAAAAHGVRALRRQRGTVEAAVAGARATMSVLVFLPVLGVGLGLLLGVDLFDVYLGASGFVTLWPGLALLVVGRSWATALVRRALSPERA